MNGGFKEEIPAYYLRLMSLFHLLGGLRCRKGQRVELHCLSLGVGQGMAKLRDTEHLYIQMPGGHLLMGFCLPAFPCWCFPVRYECVCASEPIFVLYLCLGPMAKCLFNPITGSVKKYPEKQNIEMVRIKNHSQMPGKPSWLQAPMFCSFPLFSQ